MEIYVLIFFLNIFNAFFTPVYQAAIPQSIKTKKNYSSGIGLSNATNQLLGALGPGTSGGVLLQPTRINRAEQPDSPIKDCCA
jgi:MFS transporter, NRE family, putaive nickel resistance protein